MKVAVITCYDQIDYIRTRTLRTAFAATPGVETIVLKNKNKGLLRYVEVPLRLIKLKFTERPDAFVMCFRGYEMLPLLVLLKGRKKLIFDEFINPVEYLEEHHVVTTRSFPGRIMLSLYRWMLKRCTFVLADTQAHANYSAKLCRLPVSHFRAIPVSCDETLFKPEKRTAHAPGPFNVFYYGNGMTPLHGLQFVLDAAVLLKNTPTITFSIIGGKEDAEAACAAANKKGARVTYERWVDFEKFPERIARAGLCLGGPFGKTLQSQFVITGKTYQFLAAAAPVVVGKNKVSELFTDKQNCLLVEPANAQAIADAVAWAAAHPHELQKIAEVGHQLYRKHFSQAVVNDMVGQLVKDMA